MSAAYSSAPYTATFASLHWNTQAVTGSHPTIDLYAPGPGAVALGPNNVFTLNFQPSPALDVSQSSVAVSINGAAVTAAVLASVHGQPAGLTARVPASILSAHGSNHIQVQFGLSDHISQQSQGTCGPTDPALYVTVYSDSGLHFDVRGAVASSGAQLPAPSPFTPDLAALPAPFAADQELTAGLPAIPSTAELTAIGRLAARLGEDAGATPLTFTAKLAGSFQKNMPDTDVLLIGTPSDNPAIAALKFGAPIKLSGRLWRDAQGHVLPASEGVILEAISPWDSQHGVLVLSGNGQEGIARAGTMLASAALRRTLHGTYALVPAAPAPPPVDPALPSTATLAQRGYANATHEGLGEHASSYVFDLDQIPQNSGTFTLVYGHAALLDPQLSSVRIDLNGQPVASRSLASGDAVRVRWTVSLPPSMMILGANTLSIRFFLGESSASCTYSPRSSLWSTLDSSSSLSVPAAGRGHQDLAGLSSLPFPLVRSGGTSDTILVVPARVDKQSDALNLAAAIGARSRSDNPALSVLPDSAVTDSILAGHTVVAEGLRADNAVVARVMNSLTVQNEAVQTMTDASALTSALAAIAAEQGSGGTIVEMTSPWDAGQTAIVITGVSATSLPVVRSSLLGGGLTGTIAVVDSLGHAQYFDTRASAGIGVTVTTRSSGRPIKPLAGFGVFLLLLIGAGSTYRQVRSRP